MTTPARALYLLRKTRARDVRVFFQMTGLLAKLLILQRRRTLPQLFAAFDPGPSVSPPEVGLHPYRLLSITDRLMRWTLKDHFCVKRSLLLFYFLRRWGYAAHVVFGVRTENEGLTGHAWVQLNARPFGEAAHPERLYRVTLRYPSA